MADNALEDARLAALQGGASNAVATYYPDSSEVGVAFEKAERKHALRIKLSRNEPAHRYTDEIREFVRAWQPKEASA